MRKQSGIDAQYGKDESDTDIVVTFKISKKKKSYREGASLCYSIRIQNSTITMFNILFWD